jgi:HlyD family secretion protein
VLSFFVYLRFTSNNHALFYLYIIRYFTKISVSSTAVNQNGISFFTATVDLEKDSDIKVGMTAEAKILNEQAKDVFTISMNSLQFDDENNPYVLVQGERNTVVKSSVIVGISDGKSVEIKNGLRSGQVIYYTKRSKSTKTSSKNSGGITPPLTGN